MSTKQQVVLVTALLGALFFCGGWGDTARAIEETELHIFGFEGVLQKADVAKALTEIKGLRIGQPPFLRDLGPTDHGIDKAHSALLRKGRDEVRLFKLKFESEDRAIASLNLETQPGQHDSINPYTIEDPKNCRNQDFGLFFDGMYWSGFRRNTDVIAIMKGDLTQEDMFHLMEEIFQGRGR
jgi:hypothetical protein